VFLSDMRYRFACRGKEYILREVVVHSRKHRNRQRSLSRAPRNGSLHIGLHSPRLASVCRRHAELLFPVGPPAHATVEQPNPSCELHDRRNTSSTCETRFDGYANESCCGARSQGFQAWTRHLPCQHWSAIAVPQLASGHDHVSQCPCRLLVGLHIAV
jgi:hypothetical protein